MNYIKKPVNSISEMKEEVEEARKVAEVKEKDYLMAVIQDAANNGRSCYQTNASKFRRL